MRQSVARRLHAALWVRYGCAEGAALVRRGSHQSTFSRALSTRVPGRKLPTLRFSRPGVKVTGVTGGCCAAVSRGLKHKRPSSEQPRRAQKPPSPAAAGATERASVLRALTSAAGRDVSHAGSQARRALVPAAATPHPRVGSAAAGESCRTSRFPWGWCSGVTDCPACLPRWVRAPAAPSSLAQPHGMHRGWCLQLHGMHRGGHLQPREQGRVRCPGG